MGVGEFIATLALALVAGGGIGVTIIHGIHERRMHKLERKEKKEDEAEAKAALEFEQRLKTIEEQMQVVTKTVNAIKESQKFVLYDRIRYIAQAYIAAGEVDFDDRRILRDMHSSYHNGLDGNGDLDKLMEAVDELPLKPR